VTTKTISVTLSDDYNSPVTCSTDWFSLVFLSGSFTAFICRIYWI